MNLPSSDEMSQLFGHVKETRYLGESNTIKNILSEDTQFATIAFCSEVSGPLEDSVQRSAGGRITYSEWEGIDKENIEVGYLSHNGSHIRFQTKEKTLLDLPFNEVTFEAHPLGLLVKTASQTYMIGNFMAVNDQLTPRERMRVVIGGESSIWLNELANLGVIDKVEWQKSQAHTKRFLLIWFTVVILLSFGIIVLM